MLTSHESFEELCALAAIGQLSVAESNKLQAHLETCATCRSEYADYKHLAHTRLPLIAPQEPAGRLTIAFSQRARDDDWRQRFIAQAQRRGFQFSADAERGPTFWSRLTQDWGSNHKLLLTVLVLLAAVALSGYRVWENEARSRAIAAELARLASQKAALERQLAQQSQILESRSAGPSASDTFRPPAFSPEQSGGKPATDESETAASRVTIGLELARVREEYSALETRAKTIEEQLQASASQSQTLKSELETSRTAEKQLAGKLEEAERALKEMTGEVRSLREGRLKDALLIANHKSRLEERVEQMREQDEALARQKTLLAADRDIRDIMTARNLHIVDVSDNDSKGRTRQPVGRIFYTENKSLVFYAFELNDKRVLNANYAFQAWGYQGANDQTARSLGIFYVDDQRQKRWALKLDDPRILQQIDAVFVTIEPPGGSKKPTGEKLLYAYLKGKPNHP